MTYVWTSSRDGQIGAVQSFATTTLTKGAHTVTLAVSDGQNPPVTRSVTVTVILDLDTDGMDDDWEALYNPSGLEPGDDLDGDGFDNLAEYQAGTDPTDPDSHPPVSTGPSGISCAAGTGGAGPLTAFAFTLALAACAAASARRGAGHSA